MQRLTAKRKSTLVAANTGLSPRGGKSRRKSESVVGRTESKGSSESQDSSSQLKRGERDKRARKIEVPEPVPVPSTLLNAASKRTSFSFLKSSGEETEDSSSSSEDDVAGDNAATVRQAALASQVFHELLPEGEDTLTPPQATQLIAKRTDLKRVGALCLALGAMDGAINERKFRKAFKMCSVVPADRRSGPEKNLVSRAVVKQQLQEATDLENSLQAEGEFNTMLFNEAVNNLFSKLSQAEGSDIEGLKVELMRLIEDLKLQHRQRDATLQQLLRKKDEKLVLQSSRERVHVEKLRRRIQELTDMIDDGTTRLYRGQYDKLVKMQLEVEEAKKEAETFRAQKVRAEMETVAMKQQLESTLRENEVLSKKLEYAIDADSLRAPLKYSLNLVRQLRQQLHGLRGIPLVHDTVDTLVDMVMDATREVASPDLAWHWWVCKEPQDEEACEAQKYKENAEAVLLSRRLQQLYNSVTDFAREYKEGEDLNTLSEVAGDASVLAHLGKNEEDLVEVPEVISAAGNVLGVINNTIHEILKTAGDCYGEAKVARAQLECLEEQLACAGEGEARESARLREVSAMEVEDIKGVVLKLEEREAELSEKLAACETALQQTRVREREMTQKVLELRGKVSGLEAVTPAMIPMGLTSFRLAVRRVLFAIRFRQLTLKHVDLVSYVRKKRSSALLDLVEPSHPAPSGDGNTSRPPSQKSRGVQVDTSPTQRRCADDTDDAPTGVERFKVWCWRCGDGPHRNVGPCPACKHALYFGINISQERKRFMMEEQERALRKWMAEFRAAQPLTDLAPRPPTFPRSAPRTASPPQAPTRVVTAVSTNSTSRSISPPKLHTTDLSLSLAPHDFEEVMWPAEILPSLWCSSVSVAQMAAKEQQRAPADTLVDEIRSYHCPTLSTAAKKRPPRPREDKPSPPEAPPVESTHLPESSGPPGCTSAEFHYHRVAVNYRDVYEERRKRLGKHAKTIQDTYPLCLEVESLRPLQHRHEWQSSFLPKSTPPKDTDLSPRDLPSEGDLHADQTVPHHVPFTKYLQQRLWKKERRRVPKPPTVAPTHPTFPAPPPLC
eukprot:Sspe_Gene.73238::Locus_44071_Transcript_1_1_Confidence_1.000_Length_3560::g.73238::m.73238